MKSSIKSLLSRSNQMFRIFTIFCFLALFTFPNEINAAEPNPLTWQQLRSNHPWGIPKGKLFNHDGYNWKVCFSFTGRANPYTHTWKTSACGGTAHYLSRYESVSSNSAPTDMSLSSTSVDENAGSNATVGTLSTTDAEGGTMTYAITADNSSFNISGSTLRATSSLDREAQSSYSVDIQVTDDGGETFSKTFTITVNDLNEAPGSLAISKDTLLNPTANMTFALVTADDPEGSTMTFEVTAGSSDFIIVDNNLMTTNSFSPGVGYEAYPITIEVSDGGGLTYDQEFTIGVYMDSDGDGAFDDQDSHPLDPDIASMSYYPSEGQWNTLVFEDTWPSKGDFDLNDFVANYQIIEYANTSNDVKRVDYKMKLKARGGVLSKGFGVEISGTDADNLDSIQGYLDGTSYQVYVEEAAGSLIVVFFRDVKVVMPGNESTEYYNTEAGDDRPFKEFEVRYFFSEAVDSDYDDAPFNPFLYSTHLRSEETHLIHHGPTEKHNSGKFGLSDDDSRPGEGKYYHTSQGLPWGLDIPGDWSHTYEGVDIIDAYPQIVDWGLSSGSTHPLWYQSPVNNKVW